ncbi:MAG: sigma-70 family RNA polymerase sigma factor [Phycisphaerae bacterium]|nr:sigma-70 family RNA polymerase sigma factor [Phycisphaerae bacterium]
MQPTLLQRVAAGEPAAVGECIDRYGGLIWSLARKLVGANADAEDAVQEVFIDLWRSADRFDPNVASEPTFVAMIARRRLIDSKRRRTRRPDQGQSIPVEDVDVPSGEQESGAAERAEEASRAAAAIRELRPEQQEILRLSVYEGWSHQRIADHLQVPLGTVKTHVRRGLIRVRELIQRGSTVIVDPQVIP